MFCCNNYSSSIQSCLFTSTVFLKSLWLILTDFISYFLEELYKARGGQKPLAKRAKPTHATNFVPRRSTRIRENFFECDVCGKKFYSKLSFLEHHKDHIIQTPSFSAFSDVAKQNTGEFNEFGTMRTLVGTLFDSSDSWEWPDVDGSERTK